MVSLSLTGWGTLLGMAIASVSILLENCAIAQITPDTTLPINSSIQRNGKTFNINGGTPVGNNLFHSFGEFSVPENTDAVFNNALNIQNIISRVTGESASHIDGLIRAEGTANLFFINPSGIIFGKNASLQIGGSFVASTANAIVFGDQGIFSATNPTTAPLLTINPSAFLFNQIATAPIQNNSANLSVGKNSLLLVGGNVNMNGGSLKALGGRVELGGLAGEGIVGLNVNDNNLTLNFPPDILRASVSLTKGAEVNVASGGGGSIAVNAQNIDILDKSSLRAGIRPFAGADNAKAGDVTLSAKGTVRIEDSSIYNAVFDLGNGGSLSVDTQNLIVRDGIVATATLSSGRAGDLVVNASESIEVTGSSSSNGTFSIDIPVNIFGFTINFSVIVPIGLFSASIDPRNLLNIPPYLYLSLPIESGNAGNMTIKTGRLIISDGAVVSAGSTTTGKAGNLFVNAKDFIEISGISGSDAPKRLGLFTIDNRVSSGLRNETSNRGQGGDLTIDTKKLIVRDGAWVTGGNAGEEPTGKLTVNASELVEITGTSVNNIPSVLATGTQRAENSNNVTINTKKLIVSNGGIILSGTSSSGKGGDLTINASESVELIGTSKQALSTDVLHQLIGFAGVSVFQEIEGSPLPSGLIAGTTGEGNPGNLTINTGQLFIQGGAQASVSTGGKANAGSLTINATSVELSGTLIERSKPERSNLKDLVGRSLLTTAASENSTGKGGDINLYTNSLKITDGAALTVSTSGQGDAGNIFIDSRMVTIEAGSAITANSQGSGIGGNIEVMAGTLRLNSGVISAETASNEGGNINLELKDLLLLRDRSNISTNAGTDLASGNGGNITINIPNGFIAAVPNENSDITANAFNGQGGKVQIEFTKVFGLQPLTRQELEQLLRTTEPEKLDPNNLPTSDITAISQVKPDLNGQVIFNTTDVDPSRGLVQLPTNLVDASQKIDTSCNVGGKQRKSSFVVTGRGGLPPQPGEALRTEAVIVNGVEGREQNRSASVNFTPDSTGTIVEAQGWVVNSLGEITLTAYPTSVTPYQSLRSTPTTCHAS